MSKTQGPIYNNGYVNIEVLFNMGHISNAVGVERVRQLKKWGLQANTDAMWAVIAMEELGEAAKAIFDITVGKDTEEHLTEEIIQAAAVLQAWAFQRAGYNTGETYQ